MQHNPTFMVFFGKCKKSEKTYNQNGKKRYIIVENIQNKEINKIILTIPAET